MTWTTKALLQAIADALPAECVTQHRMRELTGLSEAQVRHAANLAEGVGLIKTTPEGCLKLTEQGLDAFEATKKAGVNAGVPRPNRMSPARQKIWNAIRLRKKFSVPDLQMLCEDVSEKSIRNYVRALEVAGFTKRLPRNAPGYAPGSHGFVRYMLVPASDCGRVAPKLKDLQPKEKQHVV
jgi:hypothetical protein